MSDSILTTKITPPPMNHPQLLLRAHLWEKLRAGRRLGNKLILLSAPAGAGKTTLLGTWARAENLPLAWLSLEQADNDLHRFWYHLLAALRRLDPEIGQEAQTALLTSPTVSLSALLTSVINDLSARKTPLLLVLDDYHLIQTTAIHESINHFIDQMPPHLQIVIATREDPPLTLARWRAKQALTEIRFADLQFSLEETDCLMNKIKDFRLPAAEIAALQRRTEGWIAGLQLAALSLERLSPAVRREYIQNFAGDDRYVGDYLVEDVLAQQAKDTQLFLMKTALLEQMNAALCDAVMDRTDSAERLRYLEEANLFLIALDPRRSWFRYHHLFADLLRHRAESSLGRAEVAEVYRRASAWYDQAGYPQEAVAYALKTKDEAYAAAVIERNLLNTFYRSETRLVHNWLNALPLDLVRQRPLMAGVYAGCLLLANQEQIQAADVQAQIEEWLGYAEQALAKQSGSLAPQIERLTIHYVDKIRAYLARYRGADVATIITLTDRALARLPKHEPMFRSALWHNLGLAYRQAGVIDSALQAFEQSRRFGERSKDFFNLASALNHLALIHCEQAALTKGLEICKEGLSVIARLSGGGIIPYAGNIYITLGSIYGEWCRFEEALEIIASGIGLLELSNARGNQKRGYLEQAHLKHVLGHTAEALADLQRAKQIFPHSGAEIEAHWAAISLRAAARNPEYLENVISWAEQQRTPDWHEQYDLSGLTYARLRYFQLAGESGQDDQLRTLLDYGARYLGTAPERYRRRIELFLFRAQIYQRLGETQSAMHCMEEALKLGRRGGYIRVFVEEGAQVERLIQLARTKQTGVSYLNRLLTAFSRQRKAEQLHAVVQPSVLPEPLTDRELEVLRLLAAGAANTEIAKKLFISINTVKTHLAHIFGKLEVSSRTQAVAAARRLRLVD
jgi:LuxR family maltose regulon positive regulatory protein